MLPNGFKAIKVFACKKLCSVWITAEGPNGVTRTFAASDMDEYVGTEADVKKDAGGFTPIKVPNGVYFTKVESYLMTGIGLD